MANHIFPLSLDGDTQAVSGDASWNGETSVVEVSAAATLTVGDAAIPGTMLTIVATTNGILVTINFTNAVSAAQDPIVVFTGSPGITVTAMWNGSAWVALCDADLAVDAQ